MLDFPSSLTEPQRALAVRHLAPIPPELHQPVLDELAGRLRSTKRGATPVYDAIRYLHRLCRAVAEGTFERNLGLEIEAERERRRRETERLAVEAAEREAASTHRAEGGRGPRPLDVWRAVQAGSGAERSKPD